MRQPVRQKNKTKTKPSHFNPCQYVKNHSSCKNKTGRLLWCAKKTVKDSGRLKCRNFCTTCRHSNNAPDRRWRKLQTITHTHSADILNFAIGTLKGSSLFHASLLFCALGTADSAVRLCNRRTGCSSDRVERMIGVCKHSKAAVIVAASKRSHREAHGELMKICVLVFINRRRQL